MNRAFVFGVAVSVVAAAGIGLTLYDYPGQIVPTVASVTSGIVVSLFSAYVIFLLQSPGFAATVVPNETKGRLPGFNDPGVATTRWVHVLVKNTSTGFLGGGTAANVGGWLVFREKLKGRRFMSKWAQQPNPIRVEQILTPGNIGLAVVFDQSQVETAKRVTLEPGEQKVLDVALKTGGSRVAYVAIPENFRYPGLRNEETALEPGEYIFDLYIEFRGSLYRAGTFSLKNGEGETPESLTLEHA